MVTASKTRRRWFQFGLRGLFVFIALFAVGLGFLVRWHHRAIRQRDAVAAMKGEVFGSAYYKTKNRITEDPPGAPMWFAWLGGIDHFYDVVQVEFGHATDDQLQYLNAFPELNYLQLTFESECTSFGLSELASFKKLKTLYLATISAIDDQTMEMIGSMKQLEQLAFECGDHVTDDGLAELSALTKLKSLTLTLGLQISDDGLASLGKLSNLEGLRLDLHQRSNCELFYLPGIAGPLSDTLIISEPKRGRALTMLGELKRLKRLAIDGGVLFSEETFSQIGQLAGLRTLEIQTNSQWGGINLALEARESPSPGFGLNDNALSHLGKLTALDLLVIKTVAGEETDIGLASLASLARLKKLELRLGPDVTDDGLASLNNCASLRRLRLHLNDRVTGEGIAKLSKLQYLDLDFNSRSKDAPPFMLRVPASIEDLVIHGPVGVTDEVLAGLAGLPNLRQLEFWSCEGLTDAGLEHLKRLPQLKDLGVLWCDRTTDAGITALRAALPSCKINFQHGPGNYGFFDRFRTLEKLDP